MKIRDFLEKWTKIFRARGIDSARLDAELILLFSLNFSRNSRLKFSDFSQKNFTNSAKNSKQNSNKFSREFLLSHDDFILPKQVFLRAEKFAKKRAKRIPLAYIFRRKEFYGRTFFVNKNVLIPRPETEEIIELSRKILNKNFMKKDVDLLEVGVGSGAIFTTLFLEFPQKFSRIFVVDLNWKILNISRKNLLNLMNDFRAKQNFSRDFRTEFRFVKSDLLAKIDDEKFDLIVANLPYVSRKWRAEKASPEILAEPEKALFASDNGNALNKKFVQQITEKNALKSGGFLILEMDPEQRNEIANFAKKFGFTEISRKEFHLVLRKK